VDSLLAPRGLDSPLAGGFGHVLVGADVDEDLLGAPVLGAPPGLDDIARLRVEKDAIGPVSFGLELLEFGLITAPVFWIVYFVGIFDEQFSKFGILESILKLVNFH
jgi:hypothetical protein